MSVVSNNILAGASGQGGAGYAIERSLRFNSGDSAYLNRTPSSAGNRKTWTWSGWVKRAKLGAQQTLFSCGAAVGTSFGFEFNGSDQLTIYDYTGSIDWQLTTTQVFRDTSAWYHFVLAIDTTNSTSTERVSLYINSAKVASFSTSNYPSQNRETYINSAVIHTIGCYQNAALFNNVYLADVHFIDGQALAATDFGETDDNGVWQPKKFDGSYNNTLAKHQGDWEGDVTGTSYSPTPISGSFDGNNSTGSAANSGTALTFTPSTAITGITKVRINAVRDALQSDDHDFQLNGTNIGGSWTAGGSIAEVEFTVNNLTTLKWATKSNGHWYRVYRIDIYYNNAYHTLLQSTAGVNGFHLDFKDNSSSSALGNDAAGSNNWTVNNLSVAAGVGNDSLVDSPTNGDTASDTGAGGEITGNYAVMNPLNTHKDNRVTLANGNLQTTSSNPAFSSFLLKSGKWYCEHTVTATGYNLCFSQINHPLGATPSSANSQSIGWYTNGSTYWGPAYAVNSSASYAIGDVLGAGIDMDNSTIKLYKNGSLVTTIDFSTGTYHRFTDGMYISQFNGTGHFNFGQRAFAHAAPSGYKSLNTANLPEPTIADGSQYFDTKLYTGDGNSSNAQTGLNFSPDFAWVKPRSAASSHNLYDTIRGDNKRLVSNATSAEQTVGFEFQSNGFDPTGSNDNGTTYATWAWDAGSSNTTIAAGGLNSSAYDQSETWSNGVTSSAGAWPGGFNTACGPITNGFNGNTGNGVCAVGGANIVWNNPQSTSTLSGTLEFYNRSDTTNYSRTAIIVHAGGTTSAITLTPNSFWQNLGTYTGITTITITGNNPGGGVIDAIKVGGKLLIDSGVSVTNVPSIASTVRANPSAGFSIVTYTGTNTTATVGHGLNATPGMVITKSRSAASLTGWMVKHRSLSSTTNVKLNGTDAAWTPSSNGYIGDLTSSSTFSLVNGSSDGNNVNQNGVTFVSYCFAPVEGYSAMGIYEADGSNDNVFIYTGFRPRWIILKRANSTDGWLIFDTARDVDNVVEAKLEANTNAAENTSTDWLDIVSNGFKIRSGQGEIASSGSTYIYMSFAEHPFKTARAR